MSAFEKIINPKSGRQVSIYSQIGKNVLRNYVQFGGTNTWTNNKWSSYTCIGLEEDKCSKQPNNRCKWSDKGNFCRKTQSASKKRGKKKWSLLKKNNKETKSKKTIGNIFSQEGIERQKKQKLIESIKIDITEKEVEVNDVQYSLQNLSEELGELKKKLKLLLEK